MRLFIALSLPRDASLPDRLKHSPPAADPSPTGSASANVDLKGGSAQCAGRIKALRPNSIHLFSVKQGALSTFRPELAEVDRIVSKELRDSSITKEEASGLQAIYQAAVVTMARRTGMSPKQIWTQFGPRILGEPDITRSEAGEIQIRGESLEAFASSFQQAEAAMESPDGLAPMMPEYNGKPSEGLARLRQVKTGAVPALFHHKEFGDIGIMYGKAGDPNNNYRHGYGLAHIDAKHPGAADKIQAFFDGPDVRELEPTVGENGRKDAGRVVLTNKKYRLAMTRNFTKGRNPASGLWVVTAFDREPLSKGRPQSSIAAPALARGRDPSTPQPAAAKDSTPDWKKRLE